MTRTKKRSGGISRFLFLFLFLGLGFVFLMVRFDESPRQVCRRIVNYVETYNLPKHQAEPPLVSAATPAPVEPPHELVEPAPELVEMPPAPAEPAELVEPPAEPVEPSPIAATAPAADAVVTANPIDPVAWLISNRNHWPREVILVEAVEFPALYRDKVVGSVHLPASSKLSVTDINADELQIEYMGTKRGLPLNATNLASLAKAAMEKANGEAARTPSSPDALRLAQTTAPVAKPSPDPSARPDRTKGIDAWTASAQMIPGINIGNTFDSTGAWETGWGNPVVTRGYVRNLARLGFKSVRLPVAWDTYADEGKITRQQFERIEEVVDWILDAEMFCVLNIHWDGGWINSASQERFPETHHTFSPEAEKKFPSYWNQIARRFEDKGEKLIFEGFNEESNFENEGSMEKAYETLNKVNQIFVDTVRQSGGNNAHRLLIIPGYTTDIDKTCQKDYRLPKDTVPGKLFISVHYYTPWPFVGLSEDASYAKMETTWGSKEDVKQLNELFDRMEDFCKRRDVPGYIGEFSMCSEKERESGIRWTTAVFNAAVKRKMVPVL
ncbi:MAG TPA: cellulase family glycosylhydrolase, partial [Roseimicrobium sp.]|nr:cellulase family glycosylhydrolase [Roseimicrobium sp.]